MKHIVCLVAAFFLCSLAGFASDYSYADFSNFTTPAKVYQARSFRGVITDDLAASIIVRDVIAFGRAGTITSIKACAQVIPTGTVTLTIQKNGTTTLLSAANFNLTTLSSPNVLQSLTLTATGATKQLTATDVITAQIDTGLTSDGRRPMIVVELQPD